MREFEEPIGRVWRRLRTQRFLAALVWSLGATLTLAAVAIGAAKLSGRSLPGPSWAPFAIAGGVGLAAAGAIALAAGPSRLDAAVAIDHAFRLNERLSTALTLPEELRESDAGRALVADAVRHVESLDLGDRFGLKAPRRAWVPLVPAAVALGMLALPQGWGQGQARARSAENKVEAKVVARQTQALGKAIAQKRKEMDKSKFAETEKLFAEIEKRAEEIAKAPPADKDKALVKLNEMHDALKERQKELGGADQVAKQLQQLKPSASEGPADPFSKELAKGDFSKAAEELRKLQEKLASGQLSEKEKQALKDQIGEMKAQLDKLSNLKERRKQLEEARKNGSLTQEQFDKQMGKLDQQARDLQKLQKLAQQLGQAQDQMAKGDMKKAAEALGMGKEQLDQMAKQMQEMEALSDAMADLQDAKEGMNGDGANQLGSRLDDGGDGRMGGGDNENGNPGQGLGRGRGKGARPEAKDATSSYDTKVKQQIGKGAAIQLGEAPPREQRKGDSVIHVQEVVEASSAQSAEALTNQKVPNNVRKHISGYFDELRKGH